MAVKYPTPITPLAPIYSSSWAINGNMTETAFHNGWNAIQPGDYELVIDQAPPVFASSVTAPYDKNQHVTIADGVVIKADPASSGLILFDFYKTNHFNFGGISRISGGVFDPNGSTNCTAIRFANSAAHGWEHGRTMPGMGTGVAIQAINDASAYLFCELVRLHDIYFLMAQTAIGFSSTISNADFEASHFTNITIDSPSNGAGGAGPYIGISVPTGLDLQKSYWPDLRIFVGSYVDGGGVAHNQDHVTGLSIASTLLASKVGAKVDSAFSGTPSAMSGLTVATGFAVGGAYPVDWFYSGQSSVSWTDPNSQVWGGVSNASNLVLPLNNYVPA